MRQTPNADPPFTHSAPLFPLHAGRVAVDPTLRLTPPPPLRPDQAHETWWMSDDRSGPLRPGQAPPSAAPGKRRLQGDGSTGIGSATELVLYVSGNSLNSTRAVRSLTTLLQRYPAGQINVRIVDVASDVDAATRDRVLYTPTLIVTDRSLRTTRLLGSLANAEVLAELLSSLGFERS